MRFTSWYQMSNYQSDQCFHQCQLTPVGSLTSAYSSSSWIFNEVSEMHSCIRRPICCYNYRYLWNIYEINGRYLLVIKQSRISTPSHKASEILPCKNKCLVSFRHCLTLIRDSALSIDTECGMGKWLALLFSLVMGAMVHLYPFYDNEQYVYRAYILLFMSGLTVYGDNIYIY